MFRNPSPPPEHHTADNVDRIGDSVYSQCWVLNALVSLSSQSKKEVIICCDMEGMDEESSYSKLEMT